MGQFFAGVNIFSTQTGFKVKQYSLPDEKLF